MRNVRQPVNMLKVQDAAALADLVGAGRAGVGLEAPEDLEGLAAGSTALKPLRDAACNRLT
jgi:hypothetical protein